MARFVLGELGEDSRVGNCNLNKDGVLVLHIDGRNSWLIPTNVPPIPPERIEVADLRLNAAGTATALKRPDPDWEARLQTGAVRIHKCSR
jgi:hypothetical protein